MEDEIFIRDDRQKKYMPKILHEILLWTPYDGSDIMQQYLYDIWMIPPGSVLERWHGKDDHRIEVTTGKNFWNEMIIDKLKDSFFWKEHFHLQEDDSYEFKL